jgi:hypothetical protein
MPEAFEVFGWIGIALCTIFFILPFQLIYNLYKETETLDRIPYFLFIAGVINCNLWCIYSVEKKLFEGLICNALGVFTNTVFLMAFCSYKYKNEMNYLIGINVSILLSIFLMDYFVFHYISINLLGTVLIFINVALYATPSQKIVLYNLKFLACCY